MDIVERLRERVRTDVVGLSFPVTYFKDMLCQEAADEIERLREALKSIRKELKAVCGDWREVSCLIDDIARSALQQQEKE